MIPVVLALCTRDQGQALSLLNWIGEMGMNHTKLFILCSHDCKVSELMEAGKKGFADVVHIPDVELVNSNWHEEGHHVKSAAGPNSLFRQAAWRFYLKEKTPWLFLEPDAIPCHRNWLRDISDEYDMALSKGKCFLGFEVKRDTHPGDVGHHMSGIGVYPFDVPQKAHTSISSGDTAFDIEGASKIVPQMHPSRIIMHRYRPPAFGSQADFEERVPAHLAIYHACKDGSIYPFLRNRLGITSSAPPIASVVQRENPGGVVRDSGSTPDACPTVDIFIKTRPHDYPWLKWCSRSVNDFCHGFRGAVIQTDDAAHPFIALSTRTIPANDKEPGYLWQQVCKLHADQHSDADFILFQDSDTIFTRPITPQEFIRDGKPIWLHSSLDQARPDQHAWVPVMEKFIGRKPQHEFMRRHPFIVPRWAFEELRKFCQYRHGKSLEDYIMGEALPGHPLALVFSEWNCMGFFLWEFHRDKVCWLKPEELDSCVYQGFTHAGEGKMQEDIAKFKQLLGSPSGDAVNGTQGEPAAAVSTPPVETLSLTEDSAITFLASIVRDNPHKARIVRKLKNQWKGCGVQHKRALRAVPAPESGTINQPRPADPQKPTTLLCIHSYPGANETFARHRDSYAKFGASRMVGVGTTDDLCVWPEGWEWVNIGDNGYMKIKGKDDHLCRRLLDTVKWCLTQPEDKFAIIEYDTIPLRTMPKWEGVSACLTGGKVNGSLANQFFHNPWLFDRESGPALVAALEQVLPESHSYPNNSPDLFFGLACERAGIKVGCNFKLFTRNRLDGPGDLDAAVEAALSRFHVIHGVKEEFEYETIMSALNGKALAMSHVQ